jgi:hypothetical protein
MNDEEETHNITTRIIEAENSSGNP